MSEASPPERPWISAAVMHHPGRVDHLPSLLASLEPLPAQVVVDPEPFGIRSPLRTAKLAWAAVPASATHHLVVQDDVLLCHDFAAALESLVVERPRHGLALYSNWNSPQNSYLVRRAAATGSPWAPLSPWEWTPTLALLLPAKDARHLAEYLRSFPDDVKDDDEMISAFCRRRGIPVIAPVPHLAQHQGIDTLAGHHGSFRATVFEPRPAPRRTSAAQDDLEAGLTRRAHVPGTYDYTVELVDSTCLIRYLRPGTGEPVGHHFGWYWHDSAALSGLDRDRITAEFDTYLVGERAMPALPAHLAIEVWVACYLLGADAWGSYPLERTAPSLRSGATPWLAPAVASWLAAGLSVEDAREMNDATRAALVELGCAAVARGRLSAPGDPRTRPGDTGPEGDAGGGQWRTLLERMADREARAHALICSDGPEAPGSELPFVAPVQVRVHRCPACGEGTEEALCGPATIPFPEWPVLGERDEPAMDLPLITVLGCERLTARSLLPVAWAAERLGGLGPARFVTRAVYWTESTAGQAPSRQWTLRLLREMDAAEAWVSLVESGLPLATAHRQNGAWVVPASTRPRRRGTSYKDGLDAHFLSPHRPAALHRLSAHYAHALHATLPRRFADYTMGGSAGRVVVPGRPGPSLSQP
ncbi:hypothetical protein [Streptomyces sp. NRRL B-1381]|uniref:hypothetical protein n=1 Tax=Streptomyces sp. NRRL B-1381 TaxID=1463829 RepID=UPI00131E32B9|nr:hypothetical protein [Streptomyces sp. NRRL B-1381]